MKQITDEAFIQKFLSKVQKSESCWRWSGSTNRPLTHIRPYGEMFFGGKRMAAHRASFLIFKGEIPDGWDVCHHCDNTLCVNPDHLFTGTRKDNMQDAVAKGRYALQRNPELSKMRKLNEESVREIIAIGRSQTYVETAKKYGVHPATIAEVIRGESWKRIAREPLTAALESK